MMGRALRREAVSVNAPVANRAQMPDFEVASAAGVALRLPIAGPGARGLAFTIDWHIRALLAGAWWLVVTLVFFGELAGFGRGFVRSHPAYPWLGIFIPAAIYLLYHPILEIALLGRTPGKRLTGVRLVDRAGQPPGRGALLLRNVFRLIDALPFAYAVGLVTCIVRKDQQRLGDLVAGTVLIYAREAVDPAEFDDRALRATASAELAIASDLIERWPELARGVRFELAQRLLAHSPSPPSAEADDAEVYAALVRLRDGHR